MPNALVTGASSGLGRALAAELAARGWGLVIDARGAEALEDARAGLAGSSAAVAVAGDLTEPAHRDELAREAGAAGGLDALVLNAGALGPSPLPLVARLSPDDLRALLEVNVVAQLALLQGLLAHLRPGARVVAITSDAARAPYPGWGGYGASKAALERLAAGLAEERPDLVVLTVDPGDMRTDMHQRAFPGEDISDRPRPEERAPALARLIEEATRSGRHELAGEGVSA